VGDEGREVEAASHEVEVVLERMLADPTPVLDAKGVGADDVQLLEIQGCPLEPSGRLDTGDHDVPTGIDASHRGLDRLGSADHVVDDAGTILQPDLSTPRPQTLGG
jgi:hypothetical protein